MSDESNEAGAPAEHSEVTVERRRNLALRRLIDEMLSQVRQVHNAAPLWTPEERVQAEAELETIMARVRREAAGLQMRKTDETPNAD